MDEQRSLAAQCDSGGQIVQLRIDPAGQDISSHVHESGDVQLLLYAAPVHEGCDHGDGAMRSTRLAAIVTVALVIGGVACFSERSSGPTGNLDGCNAQLPAEAFGSTIVVIRDFTFSPATVRVRPGTKVTWVNCGPAGDESHTSTADGGAWNSPLLAPGSTFTHEYATAGSFPYHCTPHPGMTGTVTVE